MEYYQKIIYVFMFLSCDFRRLKDYFNSTYKLSISLTAIANVFPNAANKESNQLRRWRMSLQTVTWLKSGGPPVAGWMEAIDWRVFTAVSLPQGPGNGSVIGRINWSVFRLWSVTERPTPSKHKDLLSRALLLWTPSINSRNKSARKGTMERRRGPVLIGGR